MSSAVTNLLAESTDDTSLIISWEPPATSNGNITSYSVSIINLKDGSAVKQEFISVELTNVMAGNLGKYILLLIAAISIGYNIIIIQKLEFPTM